MENEKIDVAKIAELLEDDISKRSLTSYQINKSKNNIRISIDGDVEGYMSKANVRFKDNKVVLTCRFKIDKKDPWSEKKTQFSTENLNDGDIANKILEII